MGPARAWETRGNGFCSKKGVLQVKLDLRAGEVTRADNLMDDAKVAVAEQLTANGEIIGLERLMKTRVRTNLYQRQSL